MGYGNSIGYCIQFWPYTGKDSILQGYENIGLGLETSVVANLVSKLPMMQTSDYHIALDNYFTSPALLRHLSAMEVAATGTMWANQMENAPLWNMVKTNKEKCGSSDVVTDVSSNMTAVCWKDNKVVNAISTFTGKQPIQQGIKTARFYISKISADIKTDVKQQEIIEMVAGSFSVSQKYFLKTCKTRKCKTGALF